VRILHVVASLDPRYGGPSTTVPRMCSALASRGHQVALLTTDRGRGWRRAEQDALTGVAVSCHAEHWPRGWAASTGLALWLRRRMREFDVVHIHNLYLFHTWWAARCCRRARVPYVISPHGSLDPWHLAHHRRRKAAYGRLLESRALRAAAALHYTSPAEQEHATRHLGPTPPGFVVPPGVDRPPVRRLADDGGLSTRHPELAGRTLVCFLGRLTAKKRLDLLIEAFAQVAVVDPDAHLVMAGPDDEGIGAALRARVAHLGLEQRVSFLGLVTGLAKAALLGRSRMLVLASEDESFGVAVAEAMAAAIPVVVSEGVALHREVTAAGAGLVVPLAPGPLAAAVLRFVADPELAARCGANGRAFAWTRLSWDQAAARLERIYGQVVAGLGEASQLVAPTIDLDAATAPLQLPDPSTALAGRPRTTGRATTP
jgi:glycosyltransferase involved in cell wall biosynthesis